MPQTPLSSTPPADTAPRLWALVPCAGTGSRSGATGPKQYQLIAGKPMVMHTLEAVLAVSRLAAVLVVVSADDAFFESIDTGAQVAHCGGATRAHSVANGLAVLLAQGAARQDWVLVHDAARCLITPALINTLIDACLDDPVGGLLALPLPDTLKQARDGRVLTTLERADKWLAQTPQMFRIGPLQSALAAAGNAVTDESSAMEAMGLQAKLVPGSSRNIKVTYPHDFVLAQNLLLSGVQ